MFTKISGINYINWEDTNAGLIESRVEILIYMKLIDLPEFFLGDFCFCPLVRQAVTLNGLKKFSNC
jgi:hypothetical protein